jgi:hypothetical protein
MAGRWYWGVFVAELLQITQFLNLTKSLVSKMISHARSFDEQRSQGEPKSMGVINKRDGWLTLPMILCYLYPLGNADVNIHCCRLPGHQG